MTKPMSDEKNDKPIVLCVDDDRLVLRSLRRLLVRELSAAVAVELADSGERALAIIREGAEAGRPVAVMVCDMVMPGMSGGQLINIVNEEFPDVRSVLLTGQAGYQSIIDVINKSRLYRFVAKPWDNDDLVMTIREAVASWQQQRTIERQNLHLQQLNWQLEQRVRQRTAELERLSSELDEKNRELIRQAGVRKRLFANISHDLRTPLTAVLGYLEGMIGGVIEGEAERDKYLRLMFGRLKSLEKLISQLFEIARLESGSMPLNMQQVDLAGWCSEMVARYREDCLARGIEFDYGCQLTEGDVGRLLVRIDAVQWERVLNNLMDNAIGHTASGGRIELRLVGEKRRVVMMLGDSGCGIPQADRDKIFEWMWRGDRARTWRGGQSSGLGLAIAREIIEMHGGTVDVTSEVGRGTTFSVSIPRVTE
ncbi:MAG: hybrid sensor histidine kinase/response regulator [Negativicutes bacterium]|nr:hybrid sensor histidine kinase/response regulator [Negativicutes bacterium]